MSDWQKPNKARATKCFSCGKVPNESESNGLWLIVCENNRDCKNALCGIGRTREQAVGNWNLMNHQFVAEVVRGR